MVCGFDSGKIPELKVVGGKARSLMMTTQAGFNVPEGFVLSVDYFKGWIDLLKTSEEWQAFLKNSGKENCDRLKLKAYESSYSQVQKESLQKALRKMPNGCLFAVRSSSPEEDLEDASFAGAYETTLGVTADKLEKAIKDSFVSMLDTRVIEYKKLKGISIEQPRIAVVVQRQLDSRVSGIAFSLNPQNNCYDEALINASFGLGETIVSGQVTPDTYVVEKNKNIILEKRIKDKKTALWLDENAGTRESLVSDINKQALSDEEILMVSDLAGKCESFYQQPMDIEWAIEDQTLYLLQARPITTYFPLYKELLTEPGEPKNLYMDMIIATQGFSDNFSVLGADVFITMLEIAKMGTMPVGEDGLILNLNGRIYMHFSHFLKAMGKAYTIKGVAQIDSTIAKIMKELNLKDYTPLKKTAKVKEMKKKSIGIIFKMLPGMLHGLRKPEEALNAYKVLSERIFKHFKEELAVKEGYFDDIVKESFGEFNNIAVAMSSIMSSMIAGATLKKMFKGKGLEEEVNAMSMDLPGNPTSEMGHMMMALAKENEFQKTAAAEEFVKKIKEKSYSKTFMDTYEDYMNRFGARGFKEIDIATKRTIDQPEAFYQQLKHLNIHDNAMIKVKERKVMAYEKLLKVAGEMGKEKKFSKVAHRHDVGMGYREHPKYLFVVALGALRKVVLRIGEEFVREGRLVHKEQIFDLHLEQVGAGQRNKTLNLQKLIEANLSKMKVTAKVKEWPKVIDSRGKIFRYTRVSETGDLMGESISAGVIRGRAKVLHSPYEKELHKGEILVTRATEPSWTPVFVNAVGVVLEIGGPLQHGAIIAREYGLPCVSGIENATEVIDDGDYIEVDGTSGLVRILEKSGVEENKPKSLRV